MGASQLVTRSTCHGLKSWAHV